MDFADATYPSICLPFVHKSIRWQSIKEKIEGAGFGTVSRVDVASKKKGDKAFNIVFVHFEEWADTPEMKVLRTDLHSSPKFFGRLTIDEDGHFWKFTKSHVPRPERKAKKVVTLADVDADLAKKYAEMAKLQKSIADLQAKRATLAMKLAADAVTKTDFPATKQDDEDAAKAVTKVDTTPTKPKRHIKKARNTKSKKSFKAVLTHGRPQPIRVPDEFPPTSPPATPPFTPPSITRVDWADMAEADAHVEE